MKHVKFNKSLCGVDLLLNVLRIKYESSIVFSDDVYTTDFFQIVFIKEANGTLLLNDQTITLEDNSIVFITENQRYQWDVDQEKFDATILVFQEDFLNDFFADQYFTYRLLYFYQTDFPLYLNVSENIKNDYLEKLKEIKTDLQHPKSDSVHLIRSILYYLLIQLNRLYSEQYNITSTISNDNLAYQFRKLVEQHIYEKQRIDDYTDILKVSRVTLNKTISKHFNVTTTEFLKSRLAFEIKMKLLFTMSTIEELADIFHFSESNHLSRFFKNQTGLTPKEYRLSYQNGSYS
ncbi:AraC family transcriptional regulator [Aquimarina spongiae]|uniref:Transcriptional regulator n=1 Tax=Aquimarina spongiae TaxID=570521 RepID=A0A1M6A3C0_9FLAO|nr:AraC family transcriptional regulator [Aquimarina spongiae]SHI30948.1 transcriptional regulator [Aquimarina spongiae]